MNINMNVRVLTYFASVWPHHSPDVCQNKHSYDEITTVSLDMHSTVKSPQYPKYSYFIKVSSTIHIYFSVTLLRYKLHR